MTARKLLVAASVVAYCVLFLIQPTWANTVQLTSQCGQVQVLNDHNHDRVTLSQNGVTHYTFKNNGTYSVTPGVYVWTFFHGAHPNGDQGTITVPSCAPSTTTTTLAPTTSTTAPVTTTTERSQCFIPEGCPTTTTSTTVVAKGSTTTSTEIGTATSVAPTSTPPPGAQLPFTGSSSLPFGAAGASLVIVGGLALALVRMFTR